MIINLFPNAMPMEGFIGGLLIGLSAAIMLLGSGRIAGVSGMAARAFMLTKNATPLSTAILFIIGLPLGAFIIQSLTGPIESHFPSSIIILVIGGILVGIGTRLGSGCTSGHGVCGMSRLSPRSLIATATFMITGILTVAFMNIMGWGW